MRAFWQDHFKSHAFNGTCQYGQTAITKISFGLKLEKPWRKIPKYLSLFQRKCRLKMWENNGTGNQYDTGYSSAWTSSSLWKQLKVHTISISRRTKMFSMGILLSSCIPIWGSGVPLIYCVRSIRNFALTKWVLSHFYRLIHRELHSIY